MRLVLTSALLLSLSLPVHAEDPLMVEVPEEQVISKEPAKIYAPLPDTPEVTSDFGASDPKDVSPPGPKAENERLPGGVACAATGSEAGPNGCTVLQEQQ